MNRSFDLSQQITYLTFDNTKERCTASCYGKDVEHMGYKGYCVV